ncbi:MAG: polysaccharide biosynthesis tyrosine autokinase [Flavobacteriales bacterium]
MENYQEKNEQIDVKEIFEKYYQYWYFFIIAIVMSIFIGFLFLRYSSKVYNASTTILVKDENNTSLGSDNIIDGIDLFGKNRNIKNEIGILRSFSLVKQTLKEVDFNISYLNEGKLTSVDIYSRSPFKIVLDSNHLQSLEVKFYVTLISKDEFVIETKVKSGQFYNLIEESYLRSSDVVFNYEEYHKFDQWIESDYFKFKLEKKDFTLYDEENWNNYAFVINDINSLTEKFLKRIKIKEIEKDASILKVSLEGNNTIKIADFLDAFSKNYLQIGLNEKNEIATNTISFINNQLIEIRDSLSNIESVLEKFKTENPKIELSKKEYGAFYQIQKLEEEQAILKLNNKYYISLKDYLIKNDNIENILSPSSMGINDPLLNNLILELSRLYSEFEITSQNTKSIHPAVKSLKNQITITKGKILENIENIIISSELSLNDIENRINEFDKLINTLPESERKLVRIQRKYNLNETTYTYLLEKRAEASIAKAGNVADNKIIDKARLSSQDPISPNSRSIYIISIFFGIIIPGIWITAKDLLNDKINSKKDVKKLCDIPILGSITHNNKGTNLVVQNHPKSAISESLRTIRTNIQYLSSDKEQKVICVSSSISGEGKSFCSMNLSSILASTNNKTVLIGADMRKPKIFDDFELNNDTGLSSYLIGVSTLKEVTQKTNDENLDIIISGPIPPNPAELLEKKIMTDLLIELKKTYKYIIIDTPPIGLVTDGQILMNKSDINLLMVRQGYTTKQMVANINEITQKNNIKNLNIILNDVKSYNSKYGYQYGYGYYEEDLNLNNKSKWTLK